jgi:hypothetical protein
MRLRAILVVVLGLCAGDRAEAQLARVERRGAAEVAGTPGEPLTLPFRVTNLSGAPASLPGEASLPPGWRGAGGGTPRDLAPGEAELRLVGVGVPAGAGAGRHVVRYRAGGTADSAVVVVAERRAIVVEPAEGGGMTIAGTAYAVRFRIVNRGNVGERLSLRAEGDHGIRPRAGSSTVFLPPAGETTVTVRGETDVRTAASLRHQVTLHASGAGPDVAAVARTMVSVVPRGAGRVPRPRLPAEVRVRAADSLSSASLSLSAAGPLDAAGRLRLDLEARTADPAGTPFARQDEYRLRLDGPGFGLQLGDGVYALSRLTEPGRYGLGAGGSVSRGLLHAGGMVSRDRRGAGRGGIAGGFARLGTERMRIGAAYAVRDSGAARWTVQAAAEPHRLLRVEAEAAPATGDSVMPRSLHLRGSSRMLSYDVLHLRGGPAYAGPASSDQDFASVTLRPFGALSLSASARRGGDLVLADDSVRAPRNVRRATVSWGSYLLVEAREAAAGETAARGDFRSVYGRLGVRLLRNGWIHPAFESGRVVALPGAAPSPYRVYSLQATVSARGGASLWAHGQLRQGASAYQLGEREVSGALSAHLPVLPRTLLRVSGQGRRIDGGAVEGSLDVTLERMLPARHRVSVRGLAVAQTLGGWRPRMYLEYAVPLGVPLPSRGEERVVARIFDAGTGRGMPDVLVRVGDRVAVTDRRGVVAFAGLPHGTHLLRVEAGAGPERVADRPLPVPVTVGEGGSARVEVGLQAAARLAGTVERLGADSAVAPMAGVTVAVVGPGGEHSAVTDAEGRFQVTGMRPGWWRVRVDASTLPRHHALRQDQHVLLQPGGSGKAWLQVVEKERAIQMIQGGELTLQE